MACLFLWPRRSRHTQLMSVLLDVLMSQMDEEKRIEWNVLWSWGAEK